LNFTDVSDLFAENASSSIRITDSGMESEIKLLYEKQPCLMVFIVLGSDNVLIWLFVNAYSPIDIMLSGRVSCLI